MKLASAIWDAAISALLDLWRRLKDTFCTSFKVENK